jgi:hypothetical protein
MALFPLSQGLHALPYVGVFAFLAMLDGAMVGVMDDVDAARTIFIESD